MAAALEQSRKDVRAGSVNKAALESGQMDLTGLRFGKQRLVSKKKKKSSLKKVIMEEREERKSAGVSDTPGAQAGALRRPTAISSVLSLDAPEFVPSAWTVGPTAAAAASSDTAGGVEAMSTSDSAGAPAPLAGPTGGSGGACSGVTKSGPVPKQVPAPVFVPSWCQQGQAQQAEWVDGELPVEEAMEQMKMLQEQARKEHEQRPRQQPTRGADLEVRHYVHQVLSDELDEKVKLMLSELVRFQERAKERDPLKYAKQKRFCVGMREAKRSVARNKAKCLILAPNLEVSTAEGGLDETVEDLIEVAREAEVPVIFALSRNRIGKALGKNIRLSIVAVLSAEGVHQQFKEVLRTTDDLRRRPSPTESHLHPRQWVLRQMSQVTSEDAEEARRRAEERAVRDAERKAERERREAQRREEEERKRLEAKAAKEADKARRAEERKAQAEKRRAEKALRQAQEEAEESEAKAEEEKRLAAEQAERDRARKEAERRAEEERRRIQEELAAKEEAARARAAAAGSESDSDDSDVDLPAGFNDSLF